ncbi:AAA family ATPase [Clostridium sp. WILCCON 0269]|uniref:AAA family ATPase n=1 Tax=Candidatus Clostridium eludens TaxID=3381663 RepID=A0ABW8SLU4_9CLOT
MDKLICLVGESGSGKSTMATLLEKEGYNYIRSYTTRKPRHEGERGHIFVDIVPSITVDNGKEGFEGALDEENIIAYTFFDKAHYWSTKEQYQGKGTSIYIIDPTGVKYLKEKVKDAEIMVIYLKADERKRKARIINRGCEKIKFVPSSRNQQKRMRMQIKTTTQQEVYRRIKYDRDVFKIIKCDYVIDANRSIEEVLEDIKRIIRREDL